MPDTTFSQEPWPSASTTTGRDAPLCLDLLREHEIAVIARGEVRDCPGVTVLCADALHLPFADRSFDLVLNMEIGGLLEETLDLLSSL